MTEETDVAIETMNIFAIAEYLAEAIKPHLEQESNVFGLIGLRILRQRIAHLKAKQHDIVR